MLNGNGGMKNRERGMPLGKPWKMSRGMPRETPRERLRKCVSGSVFGNALENMLRPFFTDHELLLII